MSASQLRGGNRTSDQLNSTRTRRRKTAALLAACAAPVAMNMAQPAMAVNKVFNAANQAWLTATNWVPNGVPTAADDIFVGAGATNDMTISNGAVDAQFVVYASPFSRRLVNATGGTGNSTLTLHGSGPNALISVTDGATFTIHGPNASSPAGGTGVLNLVLNASGGLETTNSSQLVISSVISETGGAQSLTKSGAGTLTLSGANTFTGAFDIFSGTVSIASLDLAGNAQALGMGTSAVGIGGSINSGALIYTGAAATTDRAFTIGSAGGSLSTTNDITYTGTIGGSGAMTKAGTGTLILSGAAGDISSIPSINISEGGLRLDNTTNNNNRIGNSTNVALSGGTLQFDGDRDALTNEAAGQLQINSGGSTVRTTVATGSTGDAQISFASIAQSAGGTVAFDLAGGVNVNLVSAPLSNGILGGWATVGSDFATVNGSNNVAAFTSTVNNTPGTWTATDNVRVNQSATVSSTTSVNSLQIADNAGSPITLTSDAALTVGSGGVIATGASGHIINGTGSLTSGGSELYVHVPTTGHTLNVDLPISGSIGLVTTGPGTTVINGANTFSGPVYVNSGTLSMGPTGTLTNNAVTVTSGSTFDVNSQNLTIGSLAGRGAVTLSSGTLSTGNNNSSTTYSGVISGTGNLTKVGTGTFKLDNANTFAGNVNVGNTNGIDDGGVLVIEHNDRLGAAANPINIYNGTLRMENGTATITLAAGTSQPNGTRGVMVAAGHNVVLHSGNGKIDVPTGSYAEFAGIISSGTSGTSPLHKIGGGTLDMRTGNHTHTGGVIIDDGTFGVNKDLNFGAVPAAPDDDAVILRNGATIRWYSNASTTGLHANRGLTIGAGGGFINWSHSSGVPQVSHSITSAPGNILTKLGDDTLQSNIAQPNMLGDLFIAEGRWNVHNNTAAGIGTIWLMAANTGVNATSIAQLGIGGTNLNLTITTPQNVVLQPTTGINSFEVNNTNNLVLNGIVSGTGGLTKGRVAGTTGTLTLGGNNTFTGGVTVQLGTLQVGADANLGDAANDITLGGTGSAGTLKLTGNLSSAGRDVTTASGGGIVDTNGFNGTLGNVSGTANFVKNSAGTLTINHARPNNLTVNAGTLEIAAQPDPFSAAGAAGVSQASALTVANGALLNIQNNKLITTSAVGSWNGSAYTDVTGLIQQGRGTSFGLGDPHWDGTTGIITGQSDATQDTLHSIGVAKGSDVLASPANPLNPLGATETTTWAGQTVTGDSTLVMYSWGGDTDLDGDLDGDDYFVLDSNVALSGSVFGFAKGDLDYDGDIDGDDYFMIDSNIGAAQSSGDVFYTAGGAVGGSAVAGMTAVPEPASLGVLGIAAASLLRRRRRN